MATPKILQPTEAQARAAGSPPIHLLLLDLAPAVVVWIRRTDT